MESMISSSTGIPRLGDILPDPGHPNYRLWANYATFARDRGELVADILAHFCPLVAVEVLDVGCGAGGTSLALAERGASVTAMDFDPKRVAALRQIATRLPLRVKKGNAQALDFPDEAFHCVVLQDVLEHLPQPDRALREVNRVLRPGGYVYVSTPNRWSPLNFISDPHWNLPGVSVLPRKAVACFITRLVRREKRVRPDFAALLSFRTIRRLFEQQGFSLRFVNSLVARALFRRPTSVVNSDFHLKLVAALQRLGLASFLTSLVNDDAGLFNAVINPTWYFVAQKGGTPNA